MAKPVERRKRVDQIKEWLDAHTDEIEGADYGQIRLDWGPGDVKAFIGRSSTLKPYTPDEPYRASAAHSREG